MGVYGSYAHRLIEAQQNNTNEVVVSEGVKEVFDKIVTAVKNFIKKIIDFIKKLLGMKPNEKNKKDLNDNLDKAEKMYENIKDVDDPEEVKKMQGEAEAINKSTENIAKEMKAEFKKFEPETFEYDKFEPETFDFEKFCQDSEDEIDQKYEDLQNFEKEVAKKMQDRHKAAGEEMKKSMESIKSNMGTSREEELLEKIKKAFDK